MTMKSDAISVVLIADDEPSMLALLAQHLKAMGHQVLEASDGELAWGLAREHLPDLVILDVMMPCMSGWEVCRKIREDVSLAHTAVIMLTGIGENLNQMTSPLYGADAYIDKPFAFSELDAKIEIALVKRKNSLSGDLPGLVRTHPDFHISYDDFGSHGVNGRLDESSPSESDVAPSPITDSEIPDDLLPDDDDVEPESGEISSARTARLARNNPQYAVDSTEDDEDAGTPAALMELVPGARRVRRASGARSPAMSRKARERNPAIQPKAKSSSKPHAKVKAMPAPKSRAKAKAKTKAAPKSAANKPKAKTAPRATAKAKTRTTPRATAKAKTRTAPKAAAKAKTAPKAAANKPKAKAAPKAAAKAKTRTTPKSAASKPKAKAAPKAAAKAKAGGKSSGARSTKVTSKASAARGNGARQSAHRR